MHFCQQMMKGSNTQGCKQQDCFTLHIFIKIAEAIAAQKKIYKFYAPALIGV
jgi:hypothetical protein